MRLMLYVRFYTNWHINKTRTTFTFPVKAFFLVKFLNSRKADDWTLGGCFRCSLETFTFHLFIYFFVVSTIQQWGQPDKWIDGMVELGRSGTRRRRWRRHRGRFSRKKTKQNKNRQVVPSSDNWHAAVVCQSPSNKSSPSLTPSSPAPAALSNSTNLLKMYGCSLNKTYSALGAKDVGLRWTRHSAAHWPPGPFSAHTEESGQRPWKQGQLHRENICLQLCLTA